jgi:sugar phosphate isomerase/epimerase
VAKFEQALGQFYWEIVAKTAPVNLSLMVRNVGFLLKNVPSAAKRSEEHFTRAIEIAEEIGAAATLGQASLGLGQLHKTRGKTAQAREWITKSTQAFEECGAEGLLQKAQQELKDLE